jgi:hypothetical protein
MLENMNGDAQKKIHEFHAALGRFVLAWTDLEFGLDTLVVETWRLCTPESRPKKFDHQLDKKLKFVRQRVKTTDALKPREPQITLLLDEIDALVATRHDYVHNAALQHRIGKESITVWMGRWLQPENKPRRDPVTVTTKQMDETADKIVGLGTRMDDLIEALIRENPGIAMEPGD